jgi:extracellular factor (EF) 3-hydroxypalmitic acid methyl ester biosynthesis protein
MMHNERFFDQTLDMIERGHSSAALPMLAGKLYNACVDTASWPQTREELRRHPLHEILMQDPFSAYSAQRPRGYPGDAGLIDIIYDRSAPGNTSALGQEMFEVTVHFQAPEGVRQRRAYAEEVVTAAWYQGKKILSLACGHFREGDSLMGQDLSNITLVDQDQISLDVVRNNHGDSANIHAANVFRHLRAAAARGERYDLIYTLGLTDYLDSRAMQMLHRLSKACLAPSGNFLLANFLPGHLGTGWMDAVMDWQLIYRGEAELESYANAIGCIPLTWRDPTGSVVWCEMTNCG